MLYTEDLIEILKNYPKRIVAVQDVNFSAPYEADLDKSDFTYQPKDKYFQLPAYGQDYLD